MILKARKEKKNLKLQSKYGVNMTKFLRIFQLFNFWFWKGTGNKALIKNEISLENWYFSCSPSYTLHVQSECNNDTARGQKLISSKWMQSAELIFRLKRWCTKSVIITAICDFYCHFNFFFLLFFSLSFYKLGIAFVVFCI